jgi:NAD(P)-dependent dehydrogenase (short-subunit alcohol dehydrogenase family)
MEQLKDKVIIVTGGSGLIGKAILDNIRHKGGIAVNVDLAVETNLEASQLQCDVTSAANICQAVEEVHKYFGRIDGLVNNAYPRTKDWGTSFEQMSADSLSKNVDWQLNSYINYCKEVILHMKKQKSGSIVNMASIYGVVGNDFTIYEGTGMEPPAAYAAIKGGLISVTRFLASRYGKDNIRINCVSPGGIFDHQTEAFVRAYEHKVPMKRMGSPDDIAPAVSFLLSEEAKYITGQNLIVDGGWTSI